MVVAELAADLILKELLKGKVYVSTSATSERIVPIYAQGEQPNKGLADEFININNNGAIRSRTEPFGVFSGNIALSIYCKANSDNTLKNKRISSMIVQCEKLTHRKSHKGFFFEFSRTSIITPTTLNIASGYATTILNIEWHTNK